MCSCNPSGVANPVNGARVEVIGRNGQPIAAATTDATGRAQLPKLPDLKREKVPLLILAEKDADFSFMPLRSNDRSLDFSRFDTGGVENAASPNRFPRIFSPTVACTAPAKPRISA